MFDFIFKRPADKPDELPTGQAAQPGLRADPAASQRAVQAEQLAALPADEAAAADFILQSTFSELRLAAAERIHGEAQLERVHAAMRNTDRRVAKLMQSRLDAIRHHHAEVQKGRTCIDQAQRLLDDEMLTPNHVAELDRMWAVIAATELAQPFAAVRAALSERLAAQVGLQRAMLDRLAALRQLASCDLPAAELALRVAELADAQEAAMNAPEHALLPRHLIKDFVSEHARLSAALAEREQHGDAYAAVEAALAEWQGAPPESLDFDKLTRQWQALPALPEGEAAQRLRARFDAVLAANPAPVRKAPKPARAEAPVRAADPHFLETLGAMEAALQQGSLQSAADCDKALKDSKLARLPQAHIERLANARAEFKRLSDWARWGGNVSREELVKAVENLPAQKIAMAELAKKVGSLRERWKALDSLSGSAPKSLWERFDAACTTAYAPAAAHFKHLSDERHTNAARAQALIAEAAGAAAPPADGSHVDWKQVAATAQRLRLAWTHLGAIDRKEKKRLDGAFAAALDTLQGPLEQQRRAEMARREQLIAAVAALDAADRHTLDALRSLQERWQEQARALPLERKAEQALWVRFRAACDAVFAKRKESAHAADAERHAHQVAKEAICARLEALAAGADLAGAARQLREAGAEWRAAGAVPRANEAKVEKRYQAAIAAVERQVDAARRGADMAQASALRDKLHLCQAREAAIADGSGAPADWDVRWAALGVLSDDYERVLRARFDAAQTAQAGDGAAYARLLEQNRATLLREVLRLEIAAGVDSGSEFARDRLKMQVEVLQSSLKSGHKGATPASGFVQLCALPALVDMRTASRIDQLLRRIGKEAR